MTTATYTMTKSAGGNSPREPLPPVVGLHAARKAAKAAALAAPKMFINVYLDGKRVDTYFSDDGKRLSP